jgi:hypothetical protein
MKLTTRTTIQILVGVILAFLGWTLGRAQTSTPAFELIVNSPGGETTIECVKGCELAWVERDLNPDSAPARSKSFKYRCTGSRCGSGRVGGWLDR